MIYIVIFSEELSKRQNSGTDKVSLNTGNSSTTSLAENNLNKTDNEI
jgi:hypothetical protein